MKLSKIVLAMLLLASASLHAESVHNIVGQIRPSNAGSFTHGDIYAQDLYTSLTAKGIKAYLIFFSWGDRNSDENRAAFVVFKDENGRFWGKQSLDFKSKWLPGETPEDRAQAFYSTKRMELISAKENVQEVAETSAP